ncbi:hypothetical protein DT603_07755 [Pseudoxanthomonas gei]|uniref:Beta-barrel assembly machine subunit BamC n=1 Tax=Pseudoxanthomonas gei TaxID=1383030 RepID=A0ABX0AAZ7_9GAMM|nr:hypothetical protein [Pseudoxanthomonas gei]NDK38734.1 hypothetical protein [Pseudoxanthomonas gei]
MRSMSPYLRPVAFAALAIAVLGVSGCKWFRKGNPDYAMSAETRPLEVPPDLNLPNTATAMKLPQTGAQASATPSNPTGFNVAGPRDEVFAKVGVALEGIDGVSIASRAQLLGSYDVTYEGASFLVRVVAVEAGAYVSAVDPRGLPAGGSAPKLIAALKAKLGA